MASIKIEEIIDYLDYDMKRVLEKAVKKTLPDVTFDRNRLFREFRRAVWHQFSVWENVPNSYVDSR